MKSYKKEKEKIKSDMIAQWAKNDALSAKEQLKSKLNAESKQSDWLKKAKRRQKFRLFYDIKFYIHLRYYTYKRKIKALWLKMTK